MQGKWKYITRVPSQSEARLAGPLAWISQDERDALMRLPPELRQKRLKAINAEVKKFQGARHG